MGYAFTHIIGGWIVGKIWEKVTKKKLNKIMWFCLLLGAILPDIDTLIDKIIEGEYHRTFTHSILFGLFIPIIVFLILNFIKGINPNLTKKINIKHISIALLIGIFTHITIDFFGIPGVPLFWPLETYFGHTGIIIIQTSIVREYPLFDGGELILLFDMILGAGWILFLTLRGKLRP